MVRVVLLVNRSRQLLISPIQNLFWASRVDGTPSHPHWSNADISLNSIDRQKIQNKSGQGSMWSFTKGQYFCGQCIVYCMVVEIMFTHGYHWFVQYTDRIMCWNCINRLMLMIYIMSRVGLSFSRLWFIHFNGWNIMMYSSSVHSIFLWC